MKYTKEILLILHEAGADGLKINKISRHVFNLHNNFFESIDIKNIQSRVSYYLRKECKNENSIIEEANKKGYYRIKTTILPNTYREYIEKLP